MKRLFTIMLLSIAIIGTAVTTVSATSWAFPFVVYDESIYVITEQSVEQIGEKLGEVTAYSDMEQQGGNFSNHYPVGTEYYAMDGVAPSQAIAIKTDSQYIRANYESPYNYNPPSMSIMEKIEKMTDPVDESIDKINDNFFKWIVIAMFFVVLVLVILAKRSEGRK